MRLDTSLQQRMDQRQTLDPRLIQAMEVLQLSAPALEQKVESELAENPALEVEQERGETGEWQWADCKLRQGSRDDSFAPHRVRAPSGERDAKMEAMANAPARGESLHTQLHNQWHVAALNADDLALGDYLLSRMDADGYLRDPAQVLLAQAPPRTGAEDIERVVKLLQKNLEPPGLGARNLRECILLQMQAEARQLREEGEATDEEGRQLERAIVERHLPDLEANRLPKISEALGVSVAAVQAAVRKLRRFHPHPGRLLAVEPVCNIYPDATVVFDNETGEAVITLARGNLPPLSVNPEIEAATRDKTADPEARKTMAQYVGKARTLIEAMEQRKITLLRVIGEAVRDQRAFFDHGPQALKPLTETEIAQRIGVHVATVSRAVSDKYLETPRGIIPLRMLFTAGTTNASGETMAWGAVQAKLKQIVDEEDKKKPLSDDALVAELKKAGITLARRTAAKYRDEMGIPTARDRKAH